MEHVLHDCLDESCKICRNGLALCSACGGAEGSLLPTCPGYRLTEAEEEAIMRGKIKSADDLRMERLGERWDAAMRGLAGSVHPSVDGSFDADPSAEGDRE